MDLNNPEGDTSVRAAIKALIQDAYNKSDYLFQMAHGPQPTTLGWINPEIAREFGVDHPLVSSAPTEPQSQPAATSESPRG